MRGTVFVCMIAAACVIGNSLIRLSATPEAIFWQQKASSPLDFEMNGPYQIERNITPTQKYLDDLVEKYEQPSVSNKSNQNTTKTMTSISIKKGTRTVCYSEPRFRKLVGGCPMNVHQTLLQGIPDNTFIFLVGDSIMRNPLMLLCRSCGVHPSCGVYKNAHGNIEGCELERGIKLGMSYIRFREISKMKLEFLLLQSYKEFWLSLYHQQLEQQGQVSPAPVPELLQWLQTTNTNAKFPDTCSGSTNNTATTTTAATALSCPKLFVLTNLSVLHSLYLPGRWAVHPKNPWQGDFTAWMSTYNQITNESNFTKQLGGHYLLSTGSYICEQKRDKQFTENVTIYINRTLEECREELSVETAYWPLIDTHIKSGKIPRLVVNDERNHKNKNNNDTNNNNNMTTASMQEAIGTICRHGVQNNHGVEWKSELVNTIAQQQHIPVVDLWNLTKSDVELYKNTRNYCAATIDGIHYRPATMWKQLTVWFQSFRQAHSSSSNNV